MGKNKALLPLPGYEPVTFIEHLASLLAAVCDEVLIVARNESDASSYKSTGVRIVTDSLPDFGPLMGLYSGLRAIHALRALVIAVDMPLLQPSLVSFLLSQPLSDSLLVPLVGNVPQVLLALYPRTILPLLEECIRQGRRDPRSLLSLVPVQYIEEAQLRLLDPQLRSFINVNTPEELLKLGD